MSSSLAIVGRGVFRERRVTTWVCQDAEGGHARFRSYEIKMVGLLSLKGREGIFARCELDNRGSCPRAFWECLRRHLVVLPHNKIPFCVSVRP